MKQGKSISELAAEIQRQAASKKDYLAPTTAMTVEASPSGGALVALADKGKFPMNRIAQTQVAEHVGIPLKYADKMLAEAPELYATNVNTWFKQAPAVRLARTLDGNMRAMLSDKYATYDNIDLAEIVLPILFDRKLAVMSSEITEKRLYIKAVDEKLFRDVPVGHKMGDGTHTIFDTCAPAIIIANSEVGFGRWVIETGCYTSACTNMALFAKGGMKKTHVGARNVLTDGMDVADMEAILSNETKRKSIEAAMFQARDVVNAAFDPALFARRVEKLTAASSNALPAPKIESVMEVVQERFSLTGDERNSVLAHLIEGGNLSQYGLHAAITRAAQDAADYDRATELEYLGGKVVELSRNEWQQLAQAA